MNERIQKLAEQAGMVEYPTGIDIKENTIWGDHNISKFAELILLECNMALTPYLRDMISRGQACDLINNHFGVE